VRIEEIRIMNNLTPPGEDDWGKCGEEEFYKPWDARERQQMHVIWGRQSGEQLYEKDSLLPIYSKFVTFLKCFVTSFYFIICPQFIHAYRNDSWIYTGAIATICLYLLWIVRTGQQIMCPLNGTVNQSAAYANYHLPVLVSVNHLASTLEARGRVSK
jgi:hypothetical protein